MKGKKVFLMFYMFACETIIQRVKITFKFHKLMFDYEFSIKFFCTFIHLFIFNFSLKIST